MESEMSDENGKSGNQGLVVFCIPLEGIKLVRGGTTTNPALVVNSS